MGFEWLLMEALFWGTLGLSVWAFVDALVRPATAYVAAGKLTKPAWVGITAIAAVLLYLMHGPLSFLGLPAVVAAVVYLVDVRPAVRGMRRGNSW
jgi:hypothetical protein